MRTINVAIVKDHNGVVKCIATVDGVKASECQININKADDNIKWTISSWFTESGFKHQGIGKHAMSRLVSYCKTVHGYPTEVEYVWNGAHEYVLDWMERHFDAICTCPIAVQKTQSDDDWSSHIYVLNKDKVLDYFCS